MTEDPHTVTIAERREALAARLAVAFGALAVESLSVGDVKAGLAHAQWSKTMEALARGAELGELPEHYRNAAEVTAGSGSSTVPVSPDV